MTDHDFDAPLCENPLQLGGIRTGTLDSPQPMGGGKVRVAMVDTGSGLRFTVGLDRGGDIFEAVHNDCPLAYLTSNDLMPPEEAYQRQNHWLRSWPGGLVTTCGPLHIGAPHADDRDRFNQHGHHSNTPAAVQAVHNPDPTRGNRDMRIEMIVRDTRVFGPNIETRRSIRCRLGEARIWIEDEVTNRGNEPAPHHWLYHVNLGYPLLQPGARFIYRGSLSDVWGSVDKADLDPWKQVPPPLSKHAGSGEGGLVVQPEPDDTGHVEVGLLDARQRRAFRVRYRADQLPQLANWLHYGTGGSYVAGIEPFSGRLVNNKPDTAGNDTANTLQAGETRKYAIDFTVLTERNEIDALLEWDAAVTTN
ncbi:DUF4432 family protein [Phycisphaerales bacterium AB-hyl4]|uniref:DUF4432 family protein n=1 Tax=Natronomicrosphaera hydrolytica TaxID=3242702 RepID=A0ABV4U1F9_9BACT